MTDPYPGRGRSDLVIALVCAVVAIGAYSGSLGHGFVYDDVYIVQNQPLFHSIGNWREIIRATWWDDAMYRPVSALALALDWSLSGGDPRWFHAVNVLVHAGVTLLVVLLARQVLAPFGAAVAGLVFAVHPVHVEAVANVVGRAELLAALFVVACVLLYRADSRLALAGGRSRRRWTVRGGVMATLLLALASKEIAFATPGLLLLADWITARETRAPFGAVVERHWGLWAACVLLAAAWMVLWLSVVRGGLGTGGPAAGLMGTSLVDRIVVMAPIVLQYVRLFVLPAELSADYSPDFLPLSHELTVTGVLGLATVVVLAAVALRVRHRAPVVTFALAWVAGSLVIVSNILFPTGIRLAERTLYLPSVGVALLFGWALVTLARRRRAAAVAVAAVLVGLGMVRTVTRVPVWRNNTVFFAHLIEDAAGSYRSYWAQGALRYEAGDSAQGERLLRRALSVYPFDPGLWFDFGTYLQRQRRHREAAEFFRAGFRLDSMHVEHAAAAISNYVAAGLIDSAEALAARAVAIDPHNDRLTIARSDIAMGRGKPDEALRLRFEAARRDPDQWRNWLYAAIAAADARDCSRLDSALGRLEALHPTLPDLDSLGRRARRIGCRPSA